MLVAADLSTAYCQWRGTSARNESVAAGAPSYPNAVWRYRTGVVFRQFAVDY
ncbi:MAG: hypothetical protein GX324_07275 [Aeromonadales bacterium]|nr:hypothetical protein [Aeromonadales bacterium]